MEKIWKKPRTIHLENEGGLYMPDGICKLVKIPSPTYEIKRNLTQAYSHVILGRIADECERIRSVIGRQSEMKPYRP